MSAKERGGTKRATSFRFSPEGLAMLKATAAELGLSEGSVLEVAIRILRRKLDLVDSGRKRRRARR